MEIVIGADCAGEDLWDDLCCSVKYYVRRVSVRCRISQCEIGTIDIITGEKWTTEFVV